MSWLLRFAATLLVVATSWVAAVAAVGVAAQWVADTAVLVFVALVTALLTAGGGAWLTARDPRRRRRRTVSTAVSSVVVFALAGTIVVFRPLPSPPPDAVATVAGQHVHFWDLPTGSQLAYRHLAAADPRPTPVIVVGGGPGEAMVSDPAKAAPFHALAQRGFDVYLYDQTGAGLSTRLDNPAGYTVARHVADLEAIRDELGAEQLVLVGVSWGGSLSASYLAEHPGRVAKVVLTSPAPMNYAEFPGAGDITAHLPDGPRQQARDLLPGNTRFLAWYGLGLVNPVAARRLVPDAEADAFFDTFLRIVRPATVCDPSTLPGTHTAGNGLHTNVFTVRDAASGVQSSVAQRLQAVDVPTLVVTGRCNYIPWAPTADYATTLPKATLVCLPDAGHAPELDQPRLYRELLENFLLDEPLPLPATSPDRPCHP